MLALKDQVCRYSEQHKSASTADIFTADAIENVPNFPSVYFLDRDVFDNSKIGLPSIEIRLAPVVLEALQDTTDISTKYFSWVHLWMPIISMARWKNELTGPLSRPRADVNILALSMKLVLWAPGEDPHSRNPRHHEYLTLKSVFLRAETAGMFSLQLLQALILLTIYEYSHAIYPAAYVSVGTCVRYGLALGIDKQRQVEIDAKNLDLEEQEEKRRVWWAIIILDRIISRSATSPEPRPDDLLPVHDKDWDDGNINADRIYPVSAPASTNMGMLARLAQSAYLLGRVYRWQFHPTGNAQFDGEEQFQLDRALRALLNLTYLEGATRLMPICPQTALCFSALIILHSQPGRISPVVPNFGAAMSLQTTPYQRHAAIAEVLQFLRPIAQESTRSTAMFFRKKPWSIEKSSPLLIHWTYLIAVTYLRIKILLRAMSDPKSAGTYHDQGVTELVAQAEHGLDTMKQKLRLLGKQWVSVDENLRALEAREVASML
ncbi:hypothetical protein PV08_00562 [Exophiala spinifera]|uniref:Xylanolytic transcriptional activator regulatory domain-containing protein n=1 Tax=Exophiala spinifera TaxID=91928 RepID=A0A0D2A5F0_9EURO|nr:uncharacterized protein PV08_00562 [Exophiala spinifera]KIW19987.1 hypothetical protein PV08_00562 [Exophiala spinifera]